MKISSLFFLFFISLNVLRAQISIIPLLNLDTYGFCAYANPHTGHPYFKKGGWDFGNGNEGIFLKAVPLTSKINLYTGVYYGSLSWGYRFNLPGGDGSASGSSVWIYHFPVFINLPEYSLGRKKKAGDDIPPLIHSLHLKIYAGLSYDYAPAWEDNNEINSSSLSIGGLSGFNYGDYANVITHKGMSVMGGVSLLLYNNVKKRESLSFSIFYWQGLINLLSIDVNYTVNGNNYYTKLYSRATSLDLVLAYNIPLNYKKWFLHKKHKDENNAQKE